MRQSISTWLVASLFSAVAVASTRADGPREVLRLVPAQAELIVKIEQPRKIAEHIANLEIFKKLQKIQAVQELYSSTKARRLYQLLAYFENKLGHSRFDLLDQLAGNGAVLAFKFTGGPPTGLLVVHARDEKLLKDFVKLALNIIEQELARQENKDRPKSSDYRQIQMIQLDKLHLAAAGPFLFASDKAQPVKEAIDRFLDGKKDSVADLPSVKEARKMFGESPLGWGWFNLEKIRSQPGVKEFFETQIFLPNPQAVINGPMLEVARRSPFLGVGLLQKGNQYLVSFRMPRGREGMHEEAALFLPPQGKGAMALLEPPNVAASFSYYLDLGQLWDLKGKFKGLPAKALDNLEKQSGKFLGGVKLGTLLKQAGPHHRLVIAQQTKSSYQKKEPNFPAFALVVDMRDPAFARNMASILRGAGFLASTQFDLKMVETKHGKSLVVTYLFPEDKELKGDDANIRFSFSPSFAATDKHFIFSSTAQLCEDLVDLSEREKTKYLPATTQFQVYSAGFAAGIQNTQEQFRTKIILEQALSPKEAQAQVQELIDLVKRLGTLQVQTRYGKNDFRFDIRIQLGQ